MKKKTVANIISLILVASLLCGCGNTRTWLINKLQEMAGEEEVQTAQPDDTVIAAAQNEQETAEEQADEKEQEPVEEVPEKVDYEVLYEPVLSETLEYIYSRDIEHDYELEYVPMGIMEMVMYQPTETLLDDICYVIEDISGDGIPELMMGYDSDPEGLGLQSYVMGLYTLKDDKPRLIMEGFARSNYRWIGNGGFFYYGSGGAAYTYIGKCHLSEDGLDVIWNDYYFTEPTDDGMGMDVYHNKTGSDDIEESELFDGNFWTTEENYIARCKALGWDSIRNYSGNTGHSSTAAPESSEGSVCMFEIPDAGSGTVKADIDGDDKPEEIRYKMTADQYDDVEYLELKIGDKKYHIEEGLYCFASYGLKCYWIRDDFYDSDYLWINYTTDGDYQDTAMYWLIDDEFVFLDQMDGIPLFGKYDEHHKFVSDTPAEPHDFLVSRMEQKLGTLFYTERCSIDVNGCPVCFDGYKYYHTGTKAYIFAAKDVPCKFLEDEYGEKEEPCTIAEGEGVIPYGTDGRTFIDLKVEGSDGLYRIYIDQDDVGYWYLTYKDGLMGSDLLTDCFEGMVFAG